MILSELNMAKKVIEEFSEQILDLIGSPGKIPTRIDIQKKIDQIKKDPTFSTIKEDLIKKISEWLDTLNIPKIVIIAGEKKNPKEMILDDLGSYGV